MQLIWFVLFIAVILGLKEVMHTSLELVQYAGNLDVFYTV